MAEVSSIRVTDVHDFFFFFFGFLLELLMAVYEATYDECFYDFIREGVKCGQTILTGI